MRIMFTVQGDGRGHMTQSIAASQALESHGHEVVAVTIGTNSSRTVPDFFRRAFGNRLSEIASPGFSFRHKRGVAPIATARKALSELGSYQRSLGTLGTLIEQTQPDLIVNFLEPLMGLFNVLCPHRVPVVAVGHQFMLNPPRFVSSRKWMLQQWTMRRYVALTGAGSTRLALSFYPAGDIPQKRLLVCPPLLRRELFDLPQDLPGQFLLTYVLNQGYTEDILRWHSLHPETPIHCFCEKPKIEPVWRYDAGLTFHKLDGAKFLQMMAGSRGVACTAGFESVSEAAWLGKSLLVVPVEGHVEQQLNALDAQRAGLATAGTRFDLTPLLASPKVSCLQSYRGWVKRATPLFLQSLEHASHVPGRLVLGTLAGPATEPASAL